MHRRSFLVAAAGALAAGSQPAVAAKVRASLFVDPANGKWGAEISSRDFSGVLQGLSPRALDGTVLQAMNPAPETSHAVILTNLPSISTQGVPGSVGSPGSCEAQSFGYCLGAYTAARNPNGSVKWPASDAVNQPSAAWLYQYAPMTNAGTALHAAAAGPRFVVASATVHTDAKGKHHLVFVTQASEAVTITELHVAPHAGRQANVKLNETMRLGYQYVTRRGSKAFPPGPCKVTYMVRTRTGATLTYSGTVQVTAQA